MDPAQEQGVLSKEIIRFLRILILSKPNIEVQNHAMVLMYGLTVFQNALNRHEEITKSDSSPDSKLTALKSLEEITGPAYKLAYEVCGMDKMPSMQPLSIPMNTMFSPGLIGAGPTAVLPMTTSQPAASLPATWQPAISQPPSPSQVESPSSRKHCVRFADPPSSPIRSTGRKTLTVREATRAAGIRRKSMENAKSPDSNQPKAPVLKGILRKTSAAPSVVSSYPEIDSMFSKDDDEDGGNVYVKCENIISKIMEMPTYKQNMKAALEAEMADDFDPTKEAPAAIKALWATSPELAGELWSSREASNVNAAQMDIQSKSKFLPIILGRQKPSGDIPSITVTDPSNKETSIFDLKPRSPFESRLPLDPVPTHPQKFVYLPSRYPILKDMCKEFKKLGPAAYVRKDSPTFKATPREDISLVGPADSPYAIIRKNQKTAQYWSSKDEIDLDTYLPFFKAVMEEEQKHLPATTIPKTHSDPVVASQLASLYAQTILPLGCNPAFKEICPCELSGRECPFLVTCTLKRCYHGPDDNHGPEENMHPSIRPTCVAWLRGDADCGHTEEEKVNGEFGHDERATRDWQGSHHRIRLHLTWNI